MKILWISSLSWKKDGQYPFPVNGTGAVAGSLFQQAMIEGLEKLGHQVDIVCDYPHKPGKTVNGGFSWSHREEAEDVAVKAINLPYVSLLFKSRFLRSAVKKKLKSTHYDAAVAYLIHQPYLSALSFVKKHSPDTKTVLICPDLPNMMDLSLNQKRLKAALKQLDMQRIYRLYPRVDGFVLFAEAMKEKIPMGNAPYSVIEGIASLNDLDSTPLSKEMFVMHAGTLHRNIGIEQIMDAMQYVQDTEITLKIFGTGEMQADIEAEASKNPRIEYMGFVDRSTLFDYQKKALALINVRNPEDAYTRYSFPSKTFEYLYSGTPFITTKLEGIPEEYAAYLHYIENQKPQTIAQAIHEAAKKAKGDSVLDRQALDSFLHTKTALPQAGKLIAFIDNLKT